MGLKDARQMIDPFIQITCKGQFKQTCAHLITGDVNMCIKLNLFNSLQSRLVLQNFLKKLKISLQWMHFFVPGRMRPRKRITYTGRRLLYSTFNVLAKVS